MPLNGQFLDKSGLTYLWSKLKTKFAAKQDTITDLADIRSGATAGATAVQQTAFETDQQRQETEIGAVANAGAKNLFDIQHPSMVRSTEYNVTSDGGVELICSNAVWTQYIITDIPVESGSEYDFTLYVDAISGTDTFRAYIRDTNSSGNVLYDSGNISTIKTITRTITSSSGKIWVGIYLNNSATAKTASAKIRGMLCPVSITDDTFVPYAKTNRELTVSGDEDRAALIAQVDGGDKNLFNIFATPTAYHASYTISGNAISAVATDYYARLAFPCVFKSGKNVFKCTVSNRVVVGGNMQIRFSKNADASGSLSNFITIAQNGDVYSEISVSADTNGYITFYLNASGTSYGNSADFSEIMLCSAADYAISPAFVPYRPSWQEMWEMIQALQNGA